jgi:hypothetical protein
MGFVAKLMTLFLSQPVDIGILSILRAATDESVKGGEFLWSAPYERNERLS